MKETTCRMSEKELLFLHRSLHHDKLFNTTKRTFTKSIYNGFLNGVLKPPKTISLWNQPKNISWWKHHLPKSPSENSHLISKQRENYSDSNFPFTKFQKRRAEKLTNRISWTAILPRHLGNPKRMLYAQSKGITLIHCFKVYQYITIKHKSIPKENNWKKLR